MAKPTAEAMSRTTPRFAISVETGIMNQALRQRKTPQIPLSYTMKSKVARTIPATSMSSETRQTMNPLRFNSFDLSPFRTRSSEG